MTVRRDGDTAWREGDCRVEEAEVLAGLLAAGVAAVDVSNCRGLHAAVAQVLLAWRPALRGAPGDPFLSEHLLPALAGIAHVATSDDRNARNDFPSVIGGEGTEGVPI